MPVPYIANFFTQIMEKIKKAFKSNCIYKFWICSISIIFLASSSVYGMDLSLKSNLRPGIFLNQKKNTHRFKHALEGVRRRDVLGFGAVAGALTAAATVLLKYSSPPGNNKVLVQQLETDISSMQNLSLMNLIRDKNTPLLLKQKAALELKRRVLDKAWESSRPELVAYLWEVFIDYCYTRFEVDLEIGHNTSTQIEMFFFSRLDPYLSIKTLVDRLREKRYPREVTHYFYSLINSAYSHNLLDKAMPPGSKITSFVHAASRIGKHDLKHAKPISLKDMSEIEYNLSDENKDQILKAKTIYSLRYSSNIEYRNILKRHIQTFRAILFGNSPNFLLKKEAISALRNFYTDEILDILATFINRPETDREIQLDEAVIAAFRHIATPQALKVLEAINNDNAREALTSLNRIFNGPRAEKVRMIIQRMRGVYENPKNLERYYEAKKKLTEQGYLPMGILYFLQNPEIVDSLISISERMGYDIYYFTAVAFGEGYIRYAEYKIETGHDMIFNNVWPVGLDDFVNQEEVLKSKGYLRHDYNGFKRIEGLATNERGVQFGVGEFTNPESALEGLVALLRNYESVVRKDMGALINDMTKEEIEALTYLYYNAGSDVGKKIIERYGVHGILGKYKYAGIKIIEARFNVNRIMGTTILLRSLRIFDSDSRALNHYLQDDRKAWICAGFQGLSRLWC